MAEAGGQQPSYSTLEVSMSYPQLSLRLQGSLREGPLVSPGTQGGKYARGRKGLGEAEQRQ